MFSYSYTYMYMYMYIGKSAYNDHLGSSRDLCYIQNCAILNRVIKRLRCMYVFPVCASIFFSFGLNSL